MMDMEKKENSQKERQNLIKFGETRGNINGYTGSETSSYRGRI